ncbi:ATP-binding protein [Candidatus Poribacteria bacterium]
MNSMFCSSRSSLTSLHIFSSIVLCASLIIPLSSYGQLPDSQDLPVVEIPESNWRYRWGDSLVDDQGTPIWIHEDTSNGEWKPVKDSSDFRKNPQKHHTLWLQILLPQGNWKYPAALLPPVSQSLEVYHDGKLIYRSGEFKPSDRNKYSTYKWHHVPLDSFEGGAGSDVLLLRIYSGKHQKIGFVDYDEMWLGSQAGLTGVIIKLGADDFILGLLIAFAGLLAVFAYFRRGQSIVLSCGAFVACIGLNLIGSSAVSQLFIRSSAVRYHLALNSIFLCPIAFYIFCEQILGPGYKKLIRRVWQLSIPLALVSSFLDVIHVYPIIHSINLFFYLMMFGLLVTSVTSIIAALRGNFEAKILNAGLAAIVLFSIHDILMYMGVFPLWQPLLSWGTIVFIICLGAILERRFAQARRQLEEYSHTLEQKVEERTQELKAAQSQMVMQSKMASLGDLVAGVAHEMNNPIGVIHSTADTASRGIRKLKNLLQADHNLDESTYSRQLQQSLKLLETNHEVITTASDRVTGIVESLRSFATLDEALFQQVDLHKNIDTTLTLIQHELRDRVTVTREYGAIPRIQCCPNELNQVFMNLLRNAVQAIEEQGAITIATYSDQDHIYIKISDTGEGIAPEDLPKIYDPGFTTQSGGVGKGLGLSIVYNIIQKHHGDIEVHSEVGKGTEVTITLPMEQTNV